MFSALQNSMTKLCSAFLDRKLNYKWYDISNAQFWSALKWECEWKKWTSWAGTSILEESQTKPHVPSHNIPITLMWKIWDKILCNNMIKQTTFSTARNCTSVSYDHSTGSINNKKTQTTNQLVRITNMILHLQRRHIQGLLRILEIQRIQILIR